MSACINVRVGGGGSSGDDDDAAERDPVLDRDDADTGETEGSGDGDRTGEANRGEQGAYEGPWAGGGTLYVVSAAAVDIAELYVTPCGAQSWGDERLGGWLLPYGWYWWITGVPECVDVLAWSSGYASWWEAAGVRVADGGSYTLVLTGGAVPGDDDDAFDDDDSGWSDDDDAGGGDICEDTCKYVADGDCDDGGPGSDYDFCEYGTDCTDCGPRPPQ
jgi:hypothetical protein